MAKIKFKKKNIVGDKYVHHFNMNDGSRQEVETTKEDYEQLGQPNPTNPTITDGEWDYSCIRPKYDNPDGELAIGEYAQDKDGRYIAKHDKYILFLEENEVDALDEVEESVITEALDKLKPNEIWQ